MEAHPLRYMVEPYNNLSFSGRASRMEFWMFNLFIVAVVTVTATVPTLATIFLVLSIYPYIAVTARRLHDINKSGFWILFFIGAYIASAYFSYYHVLWSILLSGFSSAEINYGELFTDSFIMLISLWGAVFALYVFYMCKPSYDGENKYGSSSLLFVKAEKA